MEIFKSLLGYEYSYDRYRCMLFDGNSASSFMVGIMQDTRIAHQGLCDAQNDIRRRNDRKTSCTMITKYSARVTLPSSHHAMGLLLSCEKV